MVNSSLERRIKLAIDWLRVNSVEGAGIIVKSTERVPYPEVTGYLIPTLIDYHLNDLAERYADWLISSQARDGYWSDPSGRYPCLFDTGQIFRGLVGQYESSGHKGCFHAMEAAGKWVESIIEPDGTIHVPDRGVWDPAIPDRILLYALEPIRRGALITGNGPLREKVDKAVGKFMADRNISEFTYLAHFHAYVMEALFDLGQHEKAQEGMSVIKRLQGADGSIPAYAGRKWTCSTALFQYALVFYKMGDKTSANIAFEYGARLQNETGGWYGSYGEPYRMLSRFSRFIPALAMYFPRSEISWANKYFLDAARFYGQRGEK